MPKISLLANYFKIFILSKKALSFGREESDRTARCQTCPSQQNSSQQKERNQPGNLINHARFYSLSCILKYLCTMELFPTNLFGQNLSSASCGIPTKFLFLSLQTPASLSSLSDLKLQTSKTHRRTCSEEAVLISNRREDNATYTA